MPAREGRAESRPADGGTNPDPLRTTRKPRHHSRLATTADEQFQPAEQAVVTLRAVNSASPRGVVKRNNSYRVLSVGNSKSRLASPAGTVFGKNHNVQPVNHLHLHRRRDPGIAARKCSPGTQGLAALVLEVLLAVVVSGAWSAVLPLNASVPLSFASFCWYSAQLPLLIVAVRSLLSGHILSGRVIKDQPAVVGNRAAEGAAAVRATDGERSAAAVYDQGPIAGKRAIAGNRGRRRFEGCCPQPTARCRR